MSTIESFLQRPLEEITKLDITEINSLYSELRSLHFNKRKDQELISRLVGRTGYYYGVLGMKLAQALSCKRSIQRDLEVRVYKETVNKKELGSKATQKGMKIEDPECLKMQENLDLVEAICDYLKNIRESLFMEHYSLRNESSMSNNRGERINEHRFDSPGGRGV